MENIHTAVNKSVNMHTLASNRLFIDTIKTKKNREREKGNRNAHSFPKFMFDGRFISLSFWIRFVISWRNFYLWNHILRSFQIIYITDMKLHFFLHWQINRLTNIIFNKFSFAEYGIYWWLILLIFVDYDWNQQQQHAS